MRTIRGTMLVGMLALLGASSASAQDYMWAAPTSLVDAPEQRNSQTAVWSGSEMIVWGGQLTLPPPTFGHADSTGGRYDPVSGRWRALSLGGAPSARVGHVALWANGWMIVWGGGYDTLGALYDPYLDTWRRMPRGPATRGPNGASAVWTGSEMIEFGGEYSGHENTNVGARYDPMADHWTVLPTLRAPTPRNNAASVWTGTEMLVWGGDLGGGAAAGDGARYNPATNAWSRMSATGAPSARIGASAVWTGHEMLVWGGYDAAHVAGLGTGARYSPATDTWAPLPMANAPVARFGQTAVWTGLAMIVWGGADSLGLEKTGAYYVPGDSAWTPLDTLGAPNARYHHSAVWTGSQMIVWGGTSYVVVGGDPVAIQDTNSGGMLNAPSGIPRWEPLRRVEGGALDERALPISPNPAHDLVRIEGVSATDVVRVTDLTGRAQLRAHAVRPYCGGVELDVRALPEGVYVVRVGEGASAKSARMVVVR